MHKRFSAVDVGGVVNVAVALNNVDEVDFATARVRVELEVNSVALDVECMLIEGVMTTMILQIDADCRNSIAKSEIELREWDEKTSETLNIYNGTESCLQKPEEKTLKNSRLS